MTVPPDATAKRRRQQQQRPQQSLHGATQNGAGGTASSSSPDDDRRSDRRSDVAVAAKLILLVLGAVLLSAVLVLMTKKVVSTRVQEQMHHLRAAINVGHVSPASDADTTRTTNDGSSKPNGSDAGTATDTAMDKSGPAGTSATTRKPQIIYTIFAGRRNRMKIQEPYWKEMVRIGAIDAVHAWDYVSGGADDKKYLEELERKYDFFRIMRPHDVSMSDFYWFDRNHSLPTALERFGDDEKEGRARFSWPPARGYTEYFQHYATTKSINGDIVHEDDIIIKGDDDVVWINSTMVRPFAEFLINRTDIFLLSASVVNQGLCAYYQQKHGAIPEWVVGEKLPLPGNGMGDMHDNSTQALALHRYFLSSEEARQKFFITDPPFYPYDFTINVNFVALRRRDFPEIVEVMNEKLVEEGRYYDEGAITWDMIRKRKKLQGIYMPLVVSHATFGAQNDKTSAVLSEYANYGKRELASFYGDILDDWRP